MLLPIITYETKCINIAAHTETFVYEILDVDASLGHHFSGYILSNSCSRLRHFVLEWQVSALVEGQHDIRCGLTSSIKGYMNVKATVSAEISVMALYSKLDRHSLCKAVKTVY
jgi:hypothetical protein